MFNNVLLVDDSEVVRKVTRRYLEIAGFEVCGEASDGVEAIEMASRLKRDFVVLDLAMPRMNGFDAARALHKLMPETPLLIFTLFERLLTGPGVPDVGVDAVISKSDGLPALAARLTSLIKPAP